LRSKAISFNRRPQILIVSGLDPSGGAGIQADIQAVTALGAHPLPVLSCLTVQDTRNVYGSEAVSADLIRQQLECLAADTPIAAIKTGALGNAAVVDVLCDFIQSRDSVPLIVDPVIKAAGGGELADRELIHAMRGRLFSQATVITPNGEELKLLGENEDEDQSARKLLAAGCRAVLATGGHGLGDDIINTLHLNDADPKQWRIPRKGGEYHGSGCTLAAAIAAGCGAGLSLEDAIAAAQAFVSDAIDHALQVGSGQAVPDRFRRERS